MAVNEFELDAFQKVAAVFPEPVLFVSTDGTIEGCNGRYSEISGYAAPELVGTRLELHIDAPAARVAAFLKLSARNHRLIPNGLAIKAKGRPPIACRVEGALIQQRSRENEGILLLRIIPKDESISKFAALNLRLNALRGEIVRRQSAEDALKRQGQWLQITLSSIGDAVITIDLTGRVTFMNPVAEAITGWSQCDALGKSLADVMILIDENTRQPIESSAESVLRKGISQGLAHHTVLVRNDGTEISIDDSASPIRDADGEVFGVVVVFHDISARREFERQMAEASRRKDEFLAMLAHELRNPLAPLVSAVKLLELIAAGEDGSASPDLQPTIQMMSRQLGQLIRLVEDLLDVSRVTSGKIKLRREPVAVEKLIAQAVESASVNAAGRIKVDGGGPSIVYGDPARLLQIFGNLLSNAVKFSNAGGTIVVTSRREEDEAVIVVRDNGIGIAPDILKQVFDLFVQADRTLARSEGGLGIGLTVVKALTELHGGTVEAYSEGLDRGAEFTVRLPLSRLETPVATFAHDMNERQDEMPPIRILIVDDNVDAAHSLARLLEVAGHQVRTAHDGRQALKAYEDFRPDAILLDIGLPGIDGYSVANAIRRDDGEAIIIAITGYGQSEDRRRAFEAGFNHHLTKPVDIGDLTSVLSSLLSKRKLNQFG